MLKIGLTGGLASGKSTVAEHFAALGAPVVDADHIAHTLTQPGMPLCALIAEHFGPTYQDHDGSLNRRALAQHIFQNPAAKQWLEETLHPPIVACMQAKLSSYAAMPYGILVIPLLLEAHLTQLVDRVLVVDLPEPLQIERAQLRDHRSPNEIHDILATQCSRATRLAAADDIIHNDTTPQAAQAQVITLDAYYRKLSALANPKQP